jgi:glycogen phosphorylase
MNPVRIAYFSMEIGLEPRIPTYAGGLGVLAGDTIRSAADLRLPMIAVSLLHRHGYFHQRIEADGSQVEAPVYWDPQEHLTELPVQIKVTLEDRRILVRAWQRDAVSPGGHRVPVLFLDTDLADNAPEDRKITDYLYGGDERYRLKQEAILGIGGVRILRALGHDQIARFHMNEGHAALLAAELLHEQMDARGIDFVDDAAVLAVRSMCVFTTHTPVAAGHDQFPPSLVREVLAGGPTDGVLQRTSLFENQGKVNMTWAALNLSRYINGVAKRHGETSRGMFPLHTVDSITNGVHLPTWVCPSFADLYDRLIPGWRTDNPSLRYAFLMPPSDVWHAHSLAKQALLRLVGQRTGVYLDPLAMTIGFARRMTGYKRPDLLFADVERLRALVRRTGPLQCIFAGKAHPRDGAGKAQIREIHSAAAELGSDVRIAFVPGYDMEAGRVIAAGVDLWLNTPDAPLEASGTSGMKAAANGVPSLSTLDGWWVEGAIEGVTGWSIDAQPDPDADAAARRAADADVVYGKLEHIILPMYYQQRERFIDVMRGAIAINGSFFNTQRMLQEYVLKAYYL